MRRGSLVTAFIVLVVAAGIGGTLIRPRGLKTPRPLRADSR